MQLFNLLPLLLIALPFSLADPDIYAGPPQKKPIPNSDSPTCYNCPLYNCPEGDGLITAYGCMKDWTDQRCMPTQIYAVEQCLIAKFTKTVTRRGMARDGNVSFQPIPLVVILYWVEMS